MNSSVKFKEQQNNIIQQNTPPPKINFFSANTHQKQNSDILRRDLC